MMREDLIEQLETWHEEDEFEEIVDAITEIPEEERDYELISHLGRALNNLERYEEAVEQFLLIEEEGREDALWHYRIGLAYYYLKRYEDARRAFEHADRLEPDDEDTLEFLDLIKKKEEKAKAAAARAARSTAARNVSAADFWDDSHPAAEQYTMASPTDGLIASVEEELVFKLPPHYVHMMKQHNGGIPRKRLFVLGGQARRRRSRLQFQAFSASDGRRSFPFADPLAAGISLSRAATLRSVLSLQHVRRTARWSCSIIVNPVTTGFPRLSMWTRQTVTALPRWRQALRRL